MSLPCIDVLQAHISEGARFAGVLQGAWDYYVLDKYQRLANTTAYNEVRAPVACKLTSVERSSAGGDLITILVLQDSFVLGKKLAAGGFGTVYKADLVKENDELQPVIVKKVIACTPDRVMPISLCDRLRHDRSVPICTCMPAQPTLPSMPSTQSMPRRAAQVMCCCCG